LGISILIRKESRMNTEMDYSVTRKCGLVFPFRSKENKEAFGRSLSKEDRDFYFKGQFEEDEPKAPEVVEPIQVDREAQTRRALAEIDRLCPSGWRAWIGPVGFFLFIAFVVVNSEDSSLSLNEYVEVVTREMAGSAQRCREGEASACALLKMQVEHMLYGSDAERCVYGDGDYESCQDAAYELLEKKGSTG
jgi:hypothetical protein